MKKILLSVFCVALTVGVNAQVRFGAKVGGTLSNLTAKYDGKAENAFKAGLGFHVGGVLEYSFSESFALQPELLFLLNNVKPKEVDSELEGASAKFSFSSIQLPVNFKYKFGVENLKFYATAGPYFGYIASAKAKVKAGGFSASFDLFEKIDEDNEFGLGLKHLDLGLGVGFGVEISKITVGVGYQYGLANLTSAKDQSLKARTFNLSIGYFF